MFFGLIKGKKFELENSLIYEVLNSNLEYNNIDSLNDFNKKFFCLYRVELFRPILNTILTKVKNGEARFKVKPLFSWDRVAGHCETATTEQLENESIFRKKDFTIVIKKITPPIIIHEIGHAIEHILNLNLNKEFRHVLASDVNGKRSTNMQLNVAVKTILKDELKSYEIKHIMSELFARFFELIAMSYEVDGWSTYQFKYNEISSFFANTIKWFNKSIIPLLNKEVDKKILKNSIEYCNTLQPYKKVWADNIHSQKNKITDMNDAKKEVQDAIKSFEHWSENKTVHTLNDGTEYYLFNDKNNSNNNVLLLNNKK